MEFSNRLVAVLNKDIEAGVAMNALAHITLGLGSAIGAESLNLDTYRDKDHRSYPNISKMPFIILRGTSNEIKKTVYAAREHNLKYGVFLDTMTGGTYVEQLAKTAERSDDNMKFFGIVVFGDKEIVTQLTKLFSLYK